MVLQENEPDNSERKEAIERAKILKTLIEIQQVSIILNTFIKSFKKNSVLKGNGVWYLHGNFNLGGTVSGRLSSSGPNLQNIPSNTKKKFGKMIKQCFISPPGWLFAGADFSSLEDKISALTTKDPNKLQVYSQGFDGHSLRAFSYYGDQMPDITQEMELKPTDRVFQIIENNSTIYRKGHDIITTPEGTKMTVEQYFDSNN